MNAVQHGQPIEIHPDTGRNLKELEVPDWPVFLDLGARSYEMSELGYLGADIVLDKFKGPLILEINARPGLAIQVANNHGLESRVARIEEEIKTCQRNPSERVAFSMQHFAS